MLVTDMGYSKEYGRQYYLKNKEKITQQRKQYYLENKAQICQSRKQSKERLDQYNEQWRREHPENVKNWGRTRYLKHGQQMLAKCKQRYVDHKDEYLERVKRYRSTWSPETVRKVEARKYGWATRKTMALYDQLFQIYGNKCACCGESNRIFLTLDHIKGDGNAERKALKNRQHGCVGKAIREPDKSKYQILCYNCNYGKQRNKGVCPHKS